MTQTDNNVISITPLLKAGHIVPYWDSWLKKAQVRLMWAMCVLSTDSLLITEEKILSKVVERFDKKYTKEQIDHYFAQRQCGGHVLVVSVKTTGVVSYCLTKLGGDFILALINEESEKTRKLFDKSSTPNID